MIREPQVMKVLNHIQSHGKITTYEAFADYQITRLPSRINDLRNRGYKIETNMVYKDGKHWAEYRMEEVEQ